MVIREKGYHSWKGDLKQTGMNWLPIFTNGIKSVARKKWAKLIFFICSSISLIFALGVYASSRPEIKALAHMMEGLSKDLTSDASIFNLYYSNYFLIFMMVMLSLFAGSDLISGDMRFKSLSLYLSRPISLLDYMKGKYSIVLFYILMFTLVPGVSLVIFKMLLTGSFSIPLKIIVAAIVSPIVLSLFLSSFIFMFSSLTSNGKLVKLTFFIVYIVSNFFAALFSEIFKNDYFRYLSIDMNISHFNSYLFGKEPVFDAPPVISGIVLLALTALCFAIVHWKLKRTEV